MKRLSLGLLLFMGIPSSYAAVQQDVCFEYYSQLKNRVQQHLYQPPVGDCQVVMKTEGNRIAGIDIQSGSAATCGAVVKAFDALLDKELPRRPNDNCRTNIFFVFNIPASEQKKYQNNTAAADKIKNKLHAQQQALTESTHSEDAPAPAGVPESSSVSDLLGEMPSDR